MDDMRHLVCFPYSVDGLHAMAADLGIKRCWFHAGASYAHYDVPKGRVDEVRARCELVSPRDVLRIARGGDPPAGSVEDMEEYKGIPVVSSVPDGWDDFNFDRFSAAADEAMGHVARWGVTVRKLVHDPAGVYAFTLSGAKVMVRY